MNLLYRAILTIVWLFPFTLCVAQNNKPRAAKEPSWVVINQPVLSEHALDVQADGGSIDLLYDRQVSVASEMMYCKRVIRILSESGIQNSSEISVDFDPAYSSLTFHSIQIIRGTERINKLELGKIKTIQQESELRRFLYNGSLSSVLFLEDVRKGDVIEYSYTIKGFNPVFKGKYTAQLATNFSIPVYQLFYRIAMPKGRSLRIENTNDDVRYAEEDKDGEHIYTWQKKHVPAKHTQDMLPEWYDPYGQISVSEFNDWKEVKDWAKQLFPSNSVPSAGLRKKIDEIKKADTTPEKRTLAALHFVQDDVRYLGIEMGEGSHRPHDPNKVFAQRFGDCKDKSYLLCIMLRNMGIDASPVLINTTSGKVMKNWLASPTIFDHCTVRVQVQGRDYWFDPTISYQRGRLADIAYPDYGHGLVVDDSLNALTVIPAHHSKGMVDVKEEFSIPNMKGGATLLVKTTYSGAFADDVRSDFNSSSLYEVQKKYKSFYAAYYENIKIDSMTYADDEASGNFVTKEYYTIDDFWEEEDNAHKAYFAPYVISSQLHRPSERKRTMPFRITYPAKYTEEVIVKLPEDWGHDAMVEDISCAAFRLRAQSNYEGGMLRLKYEYESLKDNVQPNETTDFMEKLDKASGAMHYMVWKKDESDISQQEKKDIVPHKKKGVNTGFIILAVLVISAGIIWWTQRR